MDTEQRLWSPTGWSSPGTSSDDAAGRSLSGAQLVLVFGDAPHERATEAIAGLRALYPDALLAGCSTAGEIAGTSVLDDSFVATAVRFHATTCRHATIRLDEVGDDSRTAGSQLGERLRRDDLRHVLVFSDGLNVNGSELVRGLESQLGADVTVTGGLAGDGPRFESTWVVADGTIDSRTIVAIGLYGHQLLVGHASLGGWDPFGPERVVTRSEGNVLYELDGRSALDLYKEYLGDHASGLPATGLLYPLTVKRTAGDTPIVRTILAIDEDQRSLTFAGDIPQGSIARLMKANFDRLIDGAAGAARTSLASSSFQPEIALLISCVGRKMVLQQRVEEEVEAVREIYGDQAVLTGFYSYGEISPFEVNQRCELHNQTMTVTALAEPRDA